MITLDEAIAKCEERIETLTESMSACDLDDTVEKLIARNSAKCADEQSQLAEWLKELAERRKQPEIIHCGECRHKGTKNCVANAWTTIFGFGVKDDFYCGLAERRTDEAD